jgi:glycosyltransferase involved in cell wall biosynthesis
VTKFSVVTISFNQAEFLERALKSVLIQDGADVEYIVVDAGSTDGSRDIIERYRPSLARVITDPDRGPADGLNKGFACATGTIYCYLNSDDTFEPGAFRRIAAAFASRPQVDVFCGHSWIVDKRDRRLRRVWSDPFDKESQAYGMSIQIQPSTFIKREAFDRCGGFNAENRKTWDGELIVSLALSGARIEVINEFLSCYRLHSTSITNAGLPIEVRRSFDQRRFRMLMQRDWQRRDDLLRLYWRLRRQLRNPIAMIERFRKGPVYRRGIS